MLSLSALVSEKRNTLFLILLFSLPAYTLFAIPIEQSVPPSNENEKGLPFIQSYSAKQWKHLTSFIDTWCVLQDSSGVMMIGSSGGVLSYNGVRWELIETTNKSIVRHMAQDARGRIYVGASDDLGYLAPDAATGKIQFVSLLNYVAPEDRTFGDIYKVYATPEGIYFQASQVLFRWNGHRLEKWTAKTSFYRAFWVNNQLYVQQPDSGLYVLQDNQLRLFHQDPVFVQHLLQFMLPLHDNTCLVGTRSEGLFRFDGKKTYPVTGDIHAFSTQYDLYNGLSLPDGTLALATLRGGLVIIDQEARIQRILNKQSGLISNAVYGMGLDRQGGLWIALNNGLSRMNLHSPFTHFTAPDGLENIYGITHHQGQIYVGAAQGLFVLDKASSPGQYATLKKDPAYGERVWGMLSYGSSLLISGGRGLYELKNGKLTQLSDINTIDLVSSVLFPDRVYVGSNGLFVMQWTGNEWKIEKIPGIHEGVHTVLETSNGDLWLPTAWQGVLRVKFPKPTSSDLKENIHQVTIERYGQSQGLPLGYYNMFLIDDQVLLRVEEEENHFQMFQFNEDQKEFELVEGFGERFGIPGKIVYPEFTHNSGQQLWLWVGNTEDQTEYWTRALLQSDGTYALNKYLFPYTDYLSTITTTYEAPNGSIWLGGLEGVIKFEPPTSSSTLAPFAALLDRMIIASDSVLYPTAISSHITLPFRENTIRFEFAAPSYEREEKNRFQYALDGYDTDWSAWTAETFKEFTHIPEGTYTFRVRARNIHGTISEETSYTFSILPPWYRIWPVYVLYILIGSGCMYGIIRWRSAKLEAEKQKLENIVVQRTQEVARKNEQLAEQAEKLKELDQVKSNFFANISHEFRTPLTLILGSLQDKLHQLKQKQQPTVLLESQEVRVMHRNAKRLLELINQLLDLSKLEAGQLQLSPQQGNLIHFFRVMADSFFSMAEYRQIHFEITFPEKPVYFYFDADKLEKIVANLLSNAFKFTPDGGKVSLEVAIFPPDERLHSVVQVVVQDSGPGITDEQLNKVFDRFYQEGKHYSDQQGTGIGLALVKELVHLHQGKVWAEQGTVEGVRFIVHLPLAQAQPDAKEDDTLETNLLLTDAHTISVMPTDQNAVGVSSEINDTTDKPLLLIVEDNEDLRHYMRRQLALQYRILESENGKLGITLAREQIPDLIISDLMMPEMDGFTLCQHIKTDERTSHIPVILLTALATHESKLQGLEIGADEYLTKPFNAQELNIRVHNLIESRRKLRERFSREIRVQPTEVTVSSMDEKFLERAMKVVEEHMSNVDFGAEEFSREIAMSRMQLHRKLTALTGLTTSDFLRTLRLKRAAQLLEARTGNVSEVAFQVGFNSLSYFSKCFREYFGISPNAYTARQESPLK